MNKKWIRLSSVALLSLYLAACDTTEETVEDDTANVVEEDETLVTEDDNQEESANEEEAELEEDHEGHEDHEDHSQPESDVKESVEIDGMADHYHTGELVELMAVMEEDSEYNDWHWYVRTDEASEWEMISGQHSDELIYEAPEESAEIRAVLYDNDHKPFAESEPVELEVDNH